MKRIVSVICIIGMLMLSLTGCSSSSEVTYSGDATKETPLVFKLPHNLNEQHTVHIALTKFAAEVYEKTEGRVKIEIYPNAQLGSETEILEQLMAGIIPLTKVSAPALATYDEGYHAFGLPYIFDDTEHYYRVMDSDIMREFFMSTEEDKFIGLTYFTSGSRSFYTKDTAIRTPEDLKGLKVRVQDMKSQTDMLKELGGTPVAMSYGEVFTALQTGVIDGTENNVTALTTGKHGEICKVYSFDEHTMIPDMVAMSSKAWEMLTPEDQQIFLDAATNATNFHKEEWDAAVEQSIAEATEMGVEFVYDVDKEAFREASAPMITKYEEKYPKVKALLDAIATIN